MRLVHVVPHINEEASGPSYSVPKLCQSLAARGHDVELSCLAASANIPNVTLDVHAQWQFFNRFAISTSHACALSEKANHGEVVHNHGLWSMVNLAAGWVVPGKYAKLVTSPRGTLSSWALDRSRTAKRLLFPLQKRVLVKAHLVHATSEMEYREIRALGIDAPILILPNGIDVPPVRNFGVQKAVRCLLFLSRLHPKKGVDLLLHAWAELQEAHPDWRLRIVGRGENQYVGQIRDLAASLRLVRCEFSPPLYGMEKAQAYYDADLFVLPTHSENFGMVVAEALAHGCPAVVTHGAPWSGLETEGCGWWINNDVEILTETLSTAMSMAHEQLATKGLKGRQWMERDFRWDSIAERMERAYCWLLDGGLPPSSVRIT